LRAVAFLTREPIDPASLLSSARRDSDGGLTLFVGAVRDHHDGRRVDHLVYEAYEPMAERELGRIQVALEDEYPGARVVIRHRIGKLAIGEVAVVIVAAAPHREEAFAACRAGIERIKAAVPIWKKEYGPEGDFWIEGCAAEHQEDC
jgi:molybdopterin synthase catalytic subunit